MKPTKVAIKKYASSHVTEEVEFPRFSSDIHPNFNTYTCLRADGHFMRITLIVDYVKEHAIPVRTKVELDTSVIDLAQPLLNAERLLGEGRYASNQEEFVNALVSVTDMMIKLSEQAMDELQGINFPIQKGHLNG